MKAFGMLETKGLIAAVEGADAMSKTSNINILEKIYIGAGLVTITITGDVGAVKSAIDAGILAIRNLGEDFLISSNIIARPHEELSNVFLIEKNIVFSQEITSKEKNQEIEAEKMPEMLFSKESEEESLVEEIETVNKEEEIQERIVVSNREDIEMMLINFEIDKVKELLSAMKISEVRKVFKSYKDNGLTSKQISKLTKENLIKKIFEFHGI